MRRLTALIPIMTLVLAGLVSFPGSAAAGSGPQWTISSSPNVGSYVNELAGVAAISASDAWAVGAWENRNPDGSPGKAHTLIEHWDGAAWSMVASPNFAHEDQGLSSIVAIASDDVWAAGGHRSGTGAQSHSEGLFEHWNGSAWSIVPGPQVPDGMQYGIAALARVPGTSTIWAVGSTVVPGGYEQTFATRWDGSAWNFVPSRIPPGGAGRFQAVAAVGDSNVMGAGVVGNDGQDNGKTLAEQWNGTKFKMVRPVSPWPGTNEIQGIGRVPGSDSMWAVGWGKNSHTQTVAEYWDGTSWTAVPTPQITTPSGSAYLFGVSAARADRVWAVGDTFDVGGQSPLIEKWDGTAWTIESIPSGGTGLRGVAHVPGTNQVWAVGSNERAIPQGTTLIEHYG